MSGRHGRSWKSCRSDRLSDDKRAIHRTRERPCAHPDASAMTARLRRPAGSRRQRVAQRRRERTMAAWDQLEARLKRRVPGSDHQDPSTPPNMRAKHGWKGNHPITFGGGSPFCVIATSEQLIRPHRLPPVKPLRASSIGMGPEDENPAPRPATPRGVLEARPRHQRTTGQAPLRQCGSSSRVPAIQDA